MGIQHDEYAMSMRFQIFRYRYLPVNFTAFVVTAGVHPATDASVDVVKERAMRTALALTP